VADRNDQLCLHISVSRLNFLQLVASVDCNCDKVKQKSVELVGLEAAVLLKIFGVC